MVRSLNALSFCNELNCSIDDRQSMLFSATQTTKVQDLARISLRPGPLHVDVDKEEATSTVSTLSQGYVVCSSDRRFLLLFTFLKKNLKKKIIVFFSSCNSVKYHGELLNYIDVPVLDLHVCSNTSVSSRHNLTQYIAGQAKTTKTNKHILRVHKCRVWNLIMHGRRSPRTRYSTGRLDHPIRSPRRPTGLHSPCGSNGTCW
jgi:hypothetical protein